MRFVDAATVERVYEKIDARRRASDQRLWEKEEKKQRKKKPRLGKVFKAFLLLVKEGKIDLSKYQVGEVGEVKAIEDKSEER